MSNKTDLLCLKIGWVLVCVVKTHNLRVPVTGKISVTCPATTYKIRSDVILRSIRRKMFESYSLA